MTLFCNRKIKPVVISYEHIKINQFKTNTYGIRINYYSNNIWSNFRSILFILLNEKQRTISTHRERRRRKHFYERKNAYGTYLESVDIKFSISAHWYWCRNFHSIHNALQFRC